MDDTHTSSNRQMQASPSICYPTEAKKTKTATKAATKRKKSCGRRSMQNIERTVPDVPTTRWIDSPGEAFWCRPSLAPIMHARTTSTRMEHVCPRFTTASPGRNFCTFFCGLPEVFVVWPARGTPRERVRASMYTQPTTREWQAFCSSISTIILIRYAVRYSK